LIKTEEDKEEKTLSEKDSDLEKEESPKEPPVSFPLLQLPRTPTPSPLRIPAPPPAKTPTPPPDDIEMTDGGAPTPSNLTAEKLNAKITVKDYDGN
jgi:hypothetical protein